MKLLNCLKRFEINVAVMTLYRITAERSIWAVRSAGKVFVCETRRTLR